MSILLELKNTVRGVTPDDETWGHIQRLLGKLQAEVAERTTASVNADLVECESELNDARDKLNQIRSHLLVLNEGANIMRLRAVVNNIITLTGVEIALLNAHSVIPEEITKGCVPQQPAQEPPYIAPPRAPTTGADMILSNGAQHIRDRAATRDQATGERTMTQTVNAFNAIFHTDISEEQGWQFMVLLKMVRGANGQINIDDYEDGAAYFALAGEAAQQERG